MHYTLPVLIASQSICGGVTAVELFLCVSLQMVVLLLSILHVDLRTSKWVVLYLQGVRCSLVTQAYIKSMGISSKVVVSQAGKP